MTIYATWFLSVQGVVVDRFPTRRAAAGRQHLANAGPALDGNL
jgi:hypothetical protein